MTERARTFLKAVIVTAKKQMTAHLLIIIASDIVRFRLFKL